jgi:DNA phosphorothioation-associated putative methyltransferase
MKTNVMDSEIEISIGKRILDDIYVHTDFLHHLEQKEDFRLLLQHALSAMNAEELKSCNVAKINIQKNRLSFLQYLNFEEDPFPTLNGSWIFDAESEKFKLRSYSLSLNPPILHRKELLVGPEHPRRAQWARITKSAEEIGLFSSGRPIGFKLNWQQLIAEKGFRLEGDQFLPIGNDVEDLGSEEFDATAPIQRHLTALSRYSLSAPIQVLFNHGLISKNTEIFDYGCGKGDDIKALEGIGIKCQGWDPHYLPGNSRTPADIVNLGFVVNVIEDPAERVEAIQQAFALARVALVVSVMLHGKDRPGKPYLDGFLTARNTFQKYFTQDELKDYIESILNVEPIMIGPGISIAFSNKNAEQQFLLGRYRSRHVAQRLLAARLDPRSRRTPREKKVKNPRLSKSERDFNEVRPTLDALWAQALDLGRFPDPMEIPEFEVVQKTVSLVRARRLIRTHFDLALLEQAAKTRSDDIKLFFVSRLFIKKSPIKEMGLRLKTDIKHFFGDMKSANQAALKLLLESADPDQIRSACELASAEGLGWLDESARSLQLHVSMLDRLPSVLRAFVACGLILWDNISEFQLIKIHVQSGKLTLLQYNDFDGQAIPLLIKRIKINIPKLDYDVYEYDSSLFPPPPLLFKSRYMHEDLPFYAQQVEFDEALESTGILDEYDKSPTLIQIIEKLSLQRMEIAGLSLQKSKSIPPIEQQCGRYLTFKDLIHCGETQARLGFANLPLNPETYNALYRLCTQVLDPVIDYFGGIKLTYGFSSLELSGKIKSRIAPELDQHASHECTRRGKVVCDRLGAAVDFLVEDEDMLEVAQWITDNLQFDRMYLYGRHKPLHISLNDTPARLVTLMKPSANGRLMPRGCAAEELAHFIKKHSFQ